jgi:uncharacterized lipoprotein YajG
MSQAFSDLFGITSGYKQTFEMGFNTVKLPITKPQLVAADTSMVFYTPNAAPSDCTIKIGGNEIFRLTPQFWTVNMFRRAIVAIGRSLDNTSALSEMKIEDIATNGDFFIVLTSNPVIKGTLTVEMSLDFVEVFQCRQQYALKGTIRIPISITVAKERMAQQYESSGRLKHRFYSTTDSLIANVNDVLVDLMRNINKQRNVSNRPFHFFSVNDDIVTFTVKEGYEVLLTPRLLRLMHFPTSWLTTTASGTGKAIMHSYQRSHFYIHLDCLDYHYINNSVSDLIKVVPNTAALDEKVLLTFHEPQYYSVARRHMNTLNIYITDTYHDGILRFDRDVAYTLHFRRSLY